MKNNTQNTILKCFVGLMCFCVALVIIALFFDNLEGVFQKMWFTALLLMPYMLPALCCFSVMAKSKLRNITSIIGLIITAASYLWNVGFIWDMFDFKDIFGDIPLYFNLMIGTYVFGHICLLLVINNKNTIVKSFQLLAIFTLLFLFITTFEPISDGIYNGDFGNKLIIVEVLLIGLGTVASPILNFVYKDDKVYPNAVNTTFNHLNQSLQNNNVIPKDAIKVENNTDFDENK